MIDDDGVAGVGVGDGAGDDDGIGDGESGDDEEESPQAIANITIAETTARRNDNIWSPKA